jgi:hypothetical protein
MMWITSRINSFYIGAPFFLEWLDIIMYRVYDCTVVYR